MRFRLRTLMIVLALGPPMIWIAYHRWASLTSPMPQPRGSIIHTARFMGNRRIGDAKLTRTLGLRQSEPTFLNPRWSEAARLKIIELYRRAGYREVEVTLLEGSKVGDTNAIFQIEEGRAATSAPSN